MGQGCRRLKLTEYYQQLQVLAGVHLGGHVGHPLAAVLTTRDYPPGSPILGKIQLKVTACIDSSVTKQ